MKVFIYCLIDPRDSSAFYVGQTCVGKSEPLGYIKKGHRRKSKRNVIQYLRRLHKLGLEASWEILEECSTIELDDFERWWIASFRVTGAILTNIADGGPSNGWLNASQEKHLRHGEKLRIVRNDPTDRLRNSEAMKLAWKTGDYRERRSVALTQTWKDISLRARHSVLQKQVQNRPEVRAAKIAGMKRAFSRKQMLKMIKVFDRSLWMRILFDEPRAVVRYQEESKC